MIGNLILIGFILVSGINTILTLIVLYKTNFLSKFDENTAALQADIDGTFVEEYSIRLRQISGWTNFTIKCRRGHWCTEGQDFQVVIKDARALFLKYYYRDAYASAFEPKEGQT